LLFSAVFGFRNPSNEIFSELDETKTQGPISPRTFQKTEEHTKWGHEVAKPHGGAAKGGPAPPCGVGPLLAASDSPSMFWNPPWKIGPWAFVSSNSENLSCVGFLKPKTAENRNWRFGILLIG
jgi:hypothetical protein